MADYEQVGPAAHAEDDKPLFILRVFGVRDDKRLGVVENRLRFLKRYSVLALVDSILVFIPFKPYHFHSYIIIIF